MGRRTLHLGVGLAWLLAVAGSALAVTRYKEAPGEAAKAPAQWPTQSTLPRTPGTPTLVVFAHPMCPCTRATLTELNRLAGRIGERARIVIDFIRPDGTPDDWETTQLWEQAGRIPHATLLSDLGSVEANRFGSATSGETMLFDAHGKLLFHGGITIARGHEGDSPGSARILSLLTTGQAPLDTAPVFGCPLHDSKETPIAP